MLAETRGICKKSAACIITWELSFQECQRPSGSPIAENQRSGRARLFKTDLRSGFTGRSERPRAMLRRRWATSHSTEPQRDAYGGADDGADDGPSVMLRHWASSHPSAQQQRGMLRVRPPSPGSARGPAPPALRRTAPQSTGKQYASYPSPSWFLDGDFASRLTFT